MVLEMSANIYRYRKREREKETPSYGISDSGINMYVHAFTEKI